ncbi:hypothetical protein ACKFRU_12365 [Corynebacterium tuberculostearicum]|uniref:hypothetical protein n=1 Tax=Corynebacterium tuberculostearicum TaxID=38304 RepID=UPI0038D12D6A
MLARPAADSSGRSFAAGRSPAGNQRPHRIDESHSAAAARQGSTAWGARGALGRGWAGGIIGHAANLARGIIRRAGPAAGFIIIAMRAFSSHTLYLYPILL